MLSAFGDLGQEDSSMGGNFLPFSQWSTGLPHPLYYFPFLHYSLTTKIDLHVSKDALAKESIIQRPKFWKSDLLPSFPLFLLQELKEATDGPAHKWCHFPASCTLSGEFLNWEFYPLHICWKSFQEEKQSILEQSICIHSAASMLKYSSAGRHEDFLLMAYYHYQF